MNNIAQIITGVFALICTSSFSQVDSSYAYIVNLTIETENGNLPLNSVQFAFASESDTISYRKKEEFSSIGLPKNRKIDLLLHWESKTIIIEDIASMMTFDAWHYLHIELSDFDQKCVSASFWNDRGEQQSNNQTDQYLSSEGKMIEGVSCHYSEIGAYHRAEYSNDPPEISHYLN